MAVNKDKYQQLVSSLGTNVTLIAVSKTKPVEDILELYELGQRDFGENYVQELVDKEAALPKDIRWHFIGHLQRNKVKYLASFVHLVHGVDSYKLLEEINNQAIKNNRSINCLLQVHIAKEETKFGFDEEELTRTLLAIEKLQQLKILNNVQVTGLMGMASFTTDPDQVRNEFRLLHSIFEKLNAGSSTQLTTLSMGMSSDYGIAIEEGGNMVRIGSLLFGARNNA